jgi:hypothetical protein
MVQLAFRRKLAALVLSLALLTPWSAQALPLNLPLGGLTEWLTFFFGDVGCSWDPGGFCRDTGASQPTTPVDQIDVGCSMDPSGLCRDTGAAEPTSPGSGRDVGCSADPDGGGCHG